MAPSRVRGSGVALINMREIFAYDRIADPPMELAPIPGKNPMDWLVHSGDLLFARQSLTLEGAGKCILTLEAPIDRTFESHLIRVRLDPKLADSEFYYYYFRSPAGRENISTIVEQVAAAGIRASDLGMLDVPIPLISEQRRIAETLGALDNKIDSNVKLNNLLQEAAEALFKYWFVDFKPWGGTAPENWTRGRLGDVLLSIKQPMKPGTQTDLPYVPIDMIPKRVLGLTEFRPNEDAQSSLIAFAKDDILVGAMRVYFHRVVIAPFAGLTRTTCFVLRPKAPAYLEYGLLLCNEDSTIAYASSGSKGSTMPYAVWDRGLADMPIVIPPPEVASEFSQLAKPLIERIRDALFEVRRLRELRDVLLPELISGRIRTLETQDLSA